MDFEIQNLQKLERLETILEDIVDKIDKEIIQTDIEWMQLKNFVKENVQNNSNTKTNGNQNEPVIELNIDDTLNNADLQLSLPKSSIADGYEEFDSD